MKRLGFAIAALAALGMAADAGAQPVRVSGQVRLDQPGALIQPDVYGQFMEHLGSGIDGGVWVGPDSDIPNIDGYRRDVVEALRALRVPVVRWPGGCYADTYNWRIGIGPREQRPPTVNRWWGEVIERSGFGTHEFFNFAELIGARTYLSINVGSGTPREAAEWIEYITSPSQSALANERRANGRQEPWRIDYLGIGNEPWGCGGRMRPAYYANIYRHFYEFVKPMGDDGALIVAAGPAGEDYNWTTTLMTEAGDMMGALALHHYTLPSGDWGRPKGQALGFSEAEWAATFFQTYRIETMIARHIEIMARAQPRHDVALAVDEWGLWYDPAPDFEGALRQQNSLRDALVAAAHFNIFHRYADRVRVANIAQMVNVLQAMILTDGPQMILTPTYHAFMLYQPFQGARVLPLTISAPRYGGVRAVDGTAAVTEDGAVVIALVNLDPNREAAVSLTLSGGAAQSVSGRVLTAAAMDAHNTFAAPDTLAPAPFDGARIEAGRLTLTLPAKALVVLSVR